MAVMEVDQNLIYSLQQKAEYEKAFIELHSAFSFLDGYSLDEINDEKTASVLILCGSVISALTFQKQTSCQKQAIKILSRALSVFSRTGNWGKQVEALNSLALCYWREGMLKEAEAWLNTSLELPIHPSSSVRLQTHCTLAMILLYENREEEALGVLQKIEARFHNYKDEHLLARFHNYYGLALKNRDYKGEAISHFQSSIYYLKRMGNRRFQGVVENNLAQLYISTGDFAEARLHALNALKIYRKLNDFGLEASSLETFAQILFNQGDFEKALESINHSIEILSKGDSYGYLLESYVTKIRILLKLGLELEALSVFAIAHELAAMRISEDKAREVRNLFKEYYSSPVPKQTQLICAPTQKSDERPERETSEIAAKDGATDICRCILPECIDPSNDLVVLELDSNNFAGYKIPSGSLLLVEKCVETPENAFSVLLDKDDCYHVGFVTYHPDLKLYSLSFGSELDPVPMDEAEVEFFGQIVAFCPPDEIDDEIRMRPLKFS